MNYSLWPTIKQRLKEKLPRAAFGMWIEPVTVLTDNGNSLVLGCPNSFSKNWVKRHYGQAIGELLARLGADGAGLEITIAPKSAAKAEIGRSDRTRPPMVQAELPYQPGRLLKIDSRFNRKFTFNDFVTGPSNEFAHQAAREMAKGGSVPSRSLYLQAETGLGKSHLSQAVGLGIINRDSSAKVLYLTTEEFTNQMVMSLRNQTVDRFKDRFRRSCHTLILEEIQFLVGKKKTQAELLHTLDCLAESGRRIVFTGSKLPQDIPGLSRELRSRMGGGLVAAISQPDYRTRVKILSLKAQRMGLDLPIAVAERLAEAFTGDVRRLESALIGLAAKSRLFNRLISLDLAEELIGVQAPSSRPDLNRVLETVCHYYQVSRQDLKSRTRTKRISQARTIALYLAREMTDESLKVIGAAVDRRHSTVAYAVSRMENEVQNQTKLGRQATLIQNRIKGV